MRIGIFGGSFNPPHKMHKEIALQLYKKNYLDKIIFVPTGKKYPKQELISGLDRLTMLKKMLRGFPQLEVSDYEIKDILVSSYQTLTHFQQEYPNDELYFICGTDNLKELDTWANYPNIIKEFKFIVLRRNQDNIAQLKQKYSTYQNHLLFCPLTLETISSTQLRKMLQEEVNPEEILNYLDDEVLQYIYNRKLYKEGKKDERNN